jgi:signal recognition particle subunit SRP54
MHRRALLESDVNIRLVMQLKRNVEAKVNLAENASQNKRRVIETIVQEELVAMLDPKTPPYQVRHCANNTHWLR